MKNKSILLVIVIGMISILFAIYNLIQTNSLAESSWGILLGCILIGTALINSKKTNGSKAN